MRNIFIALLVVTAVVASTSFSERTAGPEEETVPEAPRVTESLNAAEQDLVAWAQTRFALVGLELPEVDISFHDDAASCEYADGIFHGDGVRPRVLICVPDHGSFASELWRRRTLVHELPHAWEFANLDDEDRSHLLTVVDAEHWLSNDVPWEQRGAERFAETIAWGLYGQLRRPTLIDVPCRELHADFLAITGFTTPGPVEQVCSPPSHPPSSIHTKGT
jgi:hypothetical protein